MWGRHPEQLSAPCEAYALREMTVSLTDQPPRTLRTHDAAEPFRTTYGQGNVPCYARKHGILRVQLGIGSWEASGSNRYGPCDVRQTSTPASKVYSGRPTCMNALSGAASGRCRSPNQSMADSKRPHLLNRDAPLVRSHCRQSPKAAAGERRGLRTNHGEPGIGARPAYPRRAATATI